MGTTALLVMDFQVGIVGSFGDTPPAAVAAASSAVTAARKAGIPVVFVRVAFRPGYPEISPRNQNFSALPGYGDVFHEGAPTTALVAELGATDADPVVVKRRVGAFASDLAQVLGGLDATHLVLAGLTTSGVVLSTVRDASDRDYELTVLSDACADPDEAVHRVLVDTVFPTQAQVVTVAEWAAKL
ncbi:cysteine hydrolase family protein [Nocardia jiangxiensis]|uniref:Cysteine hydrolase family protein n=1 Tax=Nocardia jiangxiensis TaxID=282685 RepID=A0ABW6SC77_9NOCA|nr:cysteine hydrolase [Nocardia jiangxiensis]